MWAASTILLVAGVIFAATILLSRAENAALAELKRISDLQTTAQRITTRGLQLAHAETENEARARQAEIQQLAARLKQAAETNFMMSGWSGELVYGAFATIDAEDIYDSLQRRLRGLARNAANLGEAQSELDIAFALSAVESQTQGSLLLDLERLVAWHNGVIEGALTFLERLQIGAAIVLAAILWAIWAAMLAPLAAAQRRAINKVKAREAEALRLADEAQVAERAKSNFLALISHEVRTPLNGVMGFAEIIQVTAKNDKTRELAGAIKNSGGQLLSLLDGMLDMANVSTGKLELVEEEFSPSALGEKISALYAPAAEDQGLEFRIDYLGDCQRLRRGDEQRILQIVSNLVSNALKFTDVGGVRLGVNAPNDDTLRLSVADDGAGMSDKQIAEAFTAFGAAAKADRGAETGAGLGLAIVKGLVDLMGGEIEVLSQRNVGTTFNIKLPVPVCEEEEKPGFEVSSYVDDFLKSQVKKSA